MTTTQQKTKIGAIYGRVSVLKDEVEHGSVEQQQHLGLELAEQIARKTGIEHHVPYILIEKKGVSGGTTKRPEFQKLQELIRHRKIDFVIAKEISRLSRSTVDFCQFMKLCEENKVAVHIRNLDVDPTTPTGAVLFQLLGVLAEFERQINRERTKSSLRSAAINNKKINGSPVVLGFDRDPSMKGRWLPNAEELKHVKFLMKKFNETLSYKSTIKEANRLGIKNKTGTPFSKNSLRSLLTNKKYIGEMYVGDDGKKVKVDLEFGSVIPRDLFQAVQESVAKVSAEYGTKNKDRARIYPLTGLLFYEDGSGFRGMSGTSKSGDKHFYYMCEKQKLSVPAKEIEAAVINALKIYDNDKELKSAIEQISKQKFDRLEFYRTQHGELKRDRDAIKNKVSTLIETLYEVKGDENSKRMKAAIEEKLADLDTEKAKLDGQLIELERDIQILEEKQVDTKTLKQSLRGLFDRLQDTDGATQRGIFRQLFNKIVVLKGNKVEISWSIPSFEVFDVTEEKCSSEGENGGTRVTDKYHFAPPTTFLISLIILSSKLTRTSLCSNKNTSMKGCLQAKLRHKFFAPKPQSRSNLKRQVFQ